MVFLLEKKKIFNINLLQLKIKYDFLKNIYFLGYFGFVKFFLNFKFLNLLFLKEKVYNYWFELNSGWLVYLLLNGLGFKSTKKIFGLNKRHWRFNVGHSQTFWYFTPRKIIMKVKQRFILIFGLNKSQITDITEKMKTFHIPDSYKGVGLKYPDEYIRLKKGKVRQ